MKSPAKSAGGNPYLFKRQPYEHQAAALINLLKREWGGALLMDPRTGKTQVAIDFASCLHKLGKVNRVLVACPFGVMGVWEDEIAAVCPYPYRLTIWDKKGRKKEELPKWGRDILDFVVVNLEAFSTPGSIVEKTEDGTIVRSQRRGGRYDIIRAFKRWQPQLVILDESHRIKSASAKKTTALQAIGKVADYRVIMTGTAVTKKKRSYDIYPQWKFLDPDGWISDYNLAGFKAEFSRHVTVPLKGSGRYDRWIRNTNTAKLRRLMHKDAFAVAIEECRDMPKVTHSPIPVDLDVRGAKLYDDMAEEMIAMIETGEITEAQIRLVVNLRLAQITSGFIKTAPESRHGVRLVRIGHEKLAVLKNRLEDLFEAEKKVVVAARFRADLASIIKMVGEMKVPHFALHGGVDRADRDTNIKSFRQIEAPACFIMQPGAGSLGIDLSTAGNMIWYSLTNSYVDWDQGWKRIHLHDGPINIEYLLARGTYDEDQYTSLLEDRDVVKMIHESPDRLRRNFKKR